MNISKHRKAILVFGVGIPSLLILVLVGLTLNGRAKLNRSHEEKVANLEAYQTSKTQVNELESFLSKESRRDKMAYWNSKLESDFIQSLSENLNRILAKYDPVVLKQTAMGQAAGAAAFGSRMENPHSRIQLSFEGGFQPMQLLLAELESEMPHLVLESLSIRTDPAKSDGDVGKLNFTIVYLCWERPRV